MHNSLGVVGLGHFVRPCWSVHRSGRECPGSGGCRSRLSDMDSDKLVFMLGAPRPAFSTLRRPSLQALTLLEGARFITWRLRRLFLEEC